MTRAWVSLIAALTISACGGQTSTPSKPKTHTAFDAGKMTEIEHDVRNRFESDPKLAEHGSVNTVNCEPQSSRTFKCLASEDAHSGGYCATIDANIDGHVDP